MTSDIEPKHVGPYSPDNGIPLVEARTRSGQRSNPAPRGEPGRLRALWEMPSDLAPVWRRLLGGLVIIQVALIMTVGIVTALQFHLLTIIDEEAHFSYVQQIAEHGSLAVLGKTKTSLEALAIAQGIYPRPTTIDPKKDGLSGYNYEAFQPPLYYVAAVPAFYASSNFIDKIYAIRLFDIGLLAASVALAGRLCRVVLAGRWLIGWSLAMVFFALPGVVVRFATISNLALAVPLAILFATELWIAWDRHSTRRLALAGVLLGLCVLTELELLLLIPVFALVVVAEFDRRRSPATWRPLAAAAAIPLALTAPWFFFNEAQYHMLTAGPIAIQEQTPIMNPGHLHFSLTQLPNDTVPILDPTLPGEWAGALSGHAALAYLDQIVAFILLPAGLVLILSMGRRLWAVPTAILGLPWALNMIELWYIRYGEQWAIFSRYTYPTLPLLLTLVALATETIRSRFVPILVLAGATFAIGALWVFLTFSYSGGYAIRF